MRSAALVLLAVALAACEATTRPGSADIQVLDDQGRTRDRVDFGSVQVGTLAREKVRIRNSGSASLQLGPDAVGVNESHFKAEMPGGLILAPGAEGEFALTFLPTDTLLVTAEATVLENPHGASATLRVSGSGIASVLVASPSAIDFGEVYAGESRSVELALTNVGSKPVSVLDAGFAPPSAELGGSLTALVGSVGLAKQVKATLVYSPTAAGELNHALAVALGDGLPTLRILVTGRAIQALPRACFRSNETGVERCTTATAPFLSVDFGGVCDRTRFPPDAGAGCRGSDGGLAPFSGSGALFFRNEGNTPVSYAVQYNARAGSVCDGGSAVDFSFSNAPAAPKWTEATTTLPMSSTDPKPWASSPISVTYRASSACAADTADQARVVWLRQGEGSGSRVPTSLEVNFVGRSMHPAGVPSDVTLSGSTPTTVSFIGVLNRGDAPLRLTSAELWHGELPDGGQSAAPVAPCSVPPTGDCRFFAWEAGWAPSDALPLTLEGTFQADAPTSAVLGKLIFGPLDAGVTPEQNAEYRVFAVIQTDDPYTPQVVSTVRGRKTQ